MKQIKASQLKELLVQKTQECLPMERSVANIMLVAESSIEKNFYTILHDLEKDSNMHFCFNLTPGTIYKPLNDLYIPDLKNGKKQYGYADEDIDFFNRPNSVIIWERFNWSSDLICKASEDIIRQRKYTSILGKVHELNNLKLVIVTAYPNNGKYRNVTISEDYLKCFEVYEVVE